MTSIARGSNYPLLPLQEQRLLFEEYVKRSGRTPSPRNRCIALSSVTHIDKTALACAVSELVSRHSSLRAVVERRLDVDERTFSERVSKWVSLAELNSPSYSQYLAAAPSLPIGWVATSDIAEADGNQHTVTDTVRTAHTEAFSLDHPPYIRATICKSEGRVAQQHLVLTLPYIMCDASSASIVARELSVLYDGATAGVRPQLTELQSYGCVIKAYADEDRASLEHWVQFWNGAAAVQTEAKDFTLAWPRVMAPLPVGQDKDSAECLTGITPSDVTESAARCETTVNVIALAALALTLHRFTFKEDIGVWCVLPNRRGPSEGVVGLFETPHMIVVHCPHDAAMTDVVGSANAAYNTALRHQSTYLKDVWHAVGRSYAKDPRVCCDVIDYRAKHGMLKRVRATPVLDGRAECELAVHIDDDVVVTASYSAAVFTRQAIDRLLSEFAAALTKVVESSIAASGVRQAVEKVS